MDNNAPYEANNAKHEEQMLVRSAGNSVQHDIKFLTQERPAIKIIRVVWKIMKILLAILLGYLLIISIPTLFMFVSSALQEKSTSLAMSISVVVVFCFAFAVVSLSIKRYQQLSQTIAPQLNGKLLIYSIVGSISLAMLLMAVVVVVNLVTQLANCEGSSCAAWIIVSFASYPVISFTALSIISIIKIVKTNKLITPPTQSR